MYNKVIMIGNLTRDIEVKYLPSGSSIANGAIATSHKYKMQSGEQKEEVCFMDFSVFGKGGEILNQYVRKGSKVMLEGRLILEQWSDQQTGAKRSRHTLRVDNFKFLDSKSDNEPQTGGHTQSNQQMQNNQQYQQKVNQGQGMVNNRQGTQYNQQSQDIPNIDIDIDEIPF